MIEAYFDASNRTDTGGVFCIAGYGFFPDAAEKLNGKWLSLFGGRLFHATDVAAGRGEFTGITSEEKANLFRVAVEAILDHAAVGIVVSCVPQDVKRLWPSFDGYKTAYAVCCRLCMAKLTTWIADQGLNDKIAYIFEAGDSNRGGAGRFMGWVAQLAAKGNTFYGYQSHTFASKRDAPILGTADLLAWEWTKLLSDLERNPRGSLRALVESERVPHLGVHMTGGQLEDYFGDFERMLKEIAGH